MLVGGGGGQVRHMIMLMILKISHKLRFKMLTTLFIGE